MFPLLRWRFQLWSGKVLNVEAREPVPEATLDRVPEATSERVPDVAIVDRVPEAILGSVPIGVREGDKLEY